MESPHNFFTFSIVKKENEPHTGTINVSRDYVEILYQEAVNAQKEITETYGFNKGETPTAYIEQNFLPPIIDHITQLLFNHCISRYLVHSLAEHKITTIGDPILETINVSPQKEAQFSFTIYEGNPYQHREWRQLMLKAPGRKNYKDIDRHVESFIEEEEVRAQTLDVAHLGDIICFDLVFLKKDGTPLLPNYTNTLWMKLTNEEVDHALQSLFEGKKKGETFVISSSPLHEYITTEPYSYAYQITIKDIIFNNCFSFEDFKKHFRLKTNKEMRHKLIEVFSFRNDVSQRRETVEAAMRLLTRFHPEDIPNHLIDTRQKMLFDQVHANPDYQVYRTKPNFKETLRALAEKQLRETSLIDAIGYQEGIHVTAEDIACYLNLAKRSRTKEFVYFNAPLNKLKDPGGIVEQEFLERYCLREKTLNYVINHLTNRS